MLTITQDSEFMTNLLPANPIRPGKRFNAFYDGEQIPAVFALSEDKKLNTLNLFITQNGKYTTVDFGAMWKFTERITAFDVRQISDGALFIAVTTQTGDKNSTVHVIADVKPADLVKPDFSKKLYAGDTYPVVYDILISDFTEQVGSTRIPKMFLSFAPSNAISKSSQLGYLAATLGTNGAIKFSLDTTWRLPTDPVSIISVTWASCDIGQGPIVLYQGSTRLHLQFTVFGQRKFAVELSCPAGANSVSSVINPSTNTSDLFVGGDQITHYIQQQYCRANSSGTKLTNGPNLQIQDVRAVQKGDYFTVWYATAKKSIEYYGAPVTSVTSGEVVPLLAEGKASQFAPLLIQQSANGMDNIVNALITLDPVGQLSLLECPLSTGMWQSVPLYEPSPTTNLEVPSFTLRFRVGSDNEQTPVQQCYLSLKCSGHIEAMSNGRTATVGQDGTWFETDSDGVLNVIVSTSDCASYTFQVDKYKSPSGTVINVSSPVLNPNGKLNEKMTFIQSGDDLLKAKTQNGQPLIEPGTVDETLADEAADVLKKLNTQQILLGQPTYDLPKLGNERRLYNPSAVTPTILAGHLPDDPSERQKFMEEISVTGLFSGWGPFNWVKEKAQQAWSWVVSKVDGAVSFIIKIAGDTFNFLMDSVEAIGKAISWVFAKIKVAIDKLIEFIGFLFGWGDILTMAENIRLYFEAATDYGMDQISTLKSLKSAWLKDLQDGLKDKTPPQFTNSGPDAKVPDNSTTVDDTRDSVSYNWTSNRMKESGMEHKSTVHDKTVASMTATEGTSLSDIWNDLQKIFYSLEETANNVGKGVGDLFKKGTSSTTVFNHMKEEFLTAAIDQADNVADLLLDAILLVLEKIKSFITDKVDIPVFGALWKTFTKSDFTILNALSLMIAIPATIIYKIAKGKAAPSLKGLNKASFGAYINNTPAPQASDLPVSRTVFFAIEGVIAAHALLLIPFFQQAKQLANYVSNSPNIMDGGTLVFTSLVLFKDWPRAGSNDMGLRWAVWGLELSNTVALGLSCLVRWYFKLPAKVVEQALSIWEVLTGIPYFVIRIIIIIRGYGRDLSALIRYTIEDTLRIVKTIANAVEKWVDEPVTKATAKAVYYGAFGVLIISKLVSFNIEAGSIPPEWGNFPAEIGWHRALMLATASSKVVWLLEPLSPEQTQEFEEKQGALRLKHQKTL